MRPLVIDPSIESAAQRIVKYAESNEYHPGKSETIPGDDPRHVLIIPLNYRCVFSITVDEDKGEKYRHLSISVPPRDKYPHQLAVREIAKLFGFTGAPKHPIEKVNAFPEDWMCGMREDEHCIVLAQKL